MKLVRELALEHILAAAVGKEHLGLVVAASQGAAGILPGLGTDIQLAVVLVPKPIHVDQSKTMQSTYLRGEDRTADKRNSDCPNMFFVGRPVPNVQKLPR